MTMLSNLSLCYITRPCRLTLICQQFQCVAGKKRGNSYLQKVLQAVPNAMSYPTFDYFFNAGLHRMSTGVWYYPLQVGQPRPGTPTCESASQLLPYLNSDLVGMLLPSTSLSLSVAFYRFLSLDAQLIDGASRYSSRSRPKRPAFYVSTTSECRSQAFHPRGALDFPWSLLCIYTLLRPLPDRHVT